MCRHLGSETPVCLFFCHLIIFVSSVHGTFTSSSRDTSSASRLEECGTVEGDRAVFLRYADRDLGSPEGFRKFRQELFSSSDLTSLVSFPAFTPNVDVDMSLESKGSRGLAVEAGVSPHVPHRLEEYSRR